MPSLRQYTGVPSRALLGFMWSGGLLGRIVSGLTILALTAPPSSAITVAQYVKMRHDKSREITEWIEIYVNGIGEAYGWSNTALQLSGKELLFCAPPKSSPERSQL